MSRPQKIKDSMQYPRMVVAVGVGCAAKIPGYCARDLYDKNGENGEVGENEKLSHFHRISRSRRQRSKSLARFP
jgi:hypothetical protein